RMTDHEPHTLGSVFGCGFAVQPHARGQFLALASADTRAQRRQAGMGAVVRAELPAVKKEDVKVTLDEGTLTITGERKQHKEDKNEKFHRVESFYGSFERSFSLPGNINADDVRCDSKDGVLTIHIPKAEAPKSKAKQITVQ